MLLLCVVDSFDLHRTLVISTDMDVYVINLRLNCMCSGKGYHRTDYPIRHTGPESFTSPKSSGSFKDRP